MSITDIDLQNNWLAYYERQIVQMVRSAYPGTGVHLRQTGETLSAWIARLTGQGYTRVQNNPCEDLFALMNALEKNSRKTPAQQSLSETWQKFNDDNGNELNVIKDELNDLKDKERQKDKDNERAYLLENGKELSDFAYLRGFHHFAAKRTVAMKKGLKWYLEYQRELLLRLQNHAWYGKVAALAYGLAVGIGLAGYMSVTIGFALITQNWWLLVFPVVMAWFPMQTNFWITRRAPSELIFDLFTSPRETKDNNWKEIAAWILGFCNATIYGGLTAYGMWEFLSVVGMMSTLPGLIFAAAATFCLGMMVFLPELGLGVKFIRQQFDKAPWERYADMCKTLDKSNKTFLGMNAYKMRFWFVLSCVVVGAVFTTLAAAGLVASLTGLNLMGAQIFLSMFTLSVLPFYFDKALKNATHACENELDGTEKKPQTWYGWSMRCGNALLNAAPAFLGGLAIFAGGFGIGFAVFTGVAGFVASYLSGEDGDQEGYEKQIDLELQATKSAITNMTSNPGEPKLQYKGCEISATKHPLFFNAFNTTPETRELELELLETVPASSVKMKNN